MFNLEEYELVEDRLKAYWNDNPNGKIKTNVVHITDDGSCVTIKAEVFADTDNGLICMATGIAQETKGQGGFANKDAWVENCETSAIGRALANWKYQGSNKRPSRQEMSKVGNSETKTKSIYAKDTTEPGQFDSKWEKKKKELIDKHNINVDKSDDSNTETPSQPSGLSSVEDLLTDAGMDFAKVPTHSNGNRKYDDNGVPTCECGRPIIIVRPEEKKSPKSPDMRCSGAGLCTAGDTVNGKVFAKSWWLDNAKTPKEYQTHYHKVIQAEKEMLGRDMEDIGEDEAPF